MTKSDNVTSYLTWISQIHDELGVVEEKIEDAEPVRITSKGFCKPWENFVCGIVARENISN